MGITATDRAHGGRARQRTDGRHLDWTAPSHNERTPPDHDATARLPPCRLLAGGGRALSELRIHGAAAAAGPGGRPRGSPVEGGADRNRSGRLLPRQRRGAAIVRAHHRRAGERTRRDHPVGVVRRGDGRTQRPLRCRGHDCGVGGAVPEQRVRVAAAGAAEGCGGARGGGAVGECAWRGVERGAAGGDR